ncbi:hypothetical protein RI054_16g76800 [Pseudoscourfieldia marina]
MASAGASGANNYPAANVQEPARTTRITAAQKDALWAYFDQKKDLKTNSRCPTTANCATFAELYNQHEFSQTQAVYQLGCWKRARGLNKQRAPRLQNLCADDVLEWLAVAAPTADEVLQNLVGSSQVCSHKPLCGLTPNSGG